MRSPSSIRPGAAAVSLALAGLVASAAAGASPEVVGAQTPDVGLQRAAGAFERAGGARIERLGSATRATDPEAARVGDVLGHLTGHPRTDARSAPVHPNRFQPDAVCAWTDLAPGAGATGRLGAGDCHVAMLDGTLDPAYVDQYRLSLPQRGSLALSAGGAAAAEIEIDVRDLAFTSLASASAAAGGTADVSLTLPAGDYLVLVRPASFVAGVETDYTLTTAFTPEATPEPSACDARPLGIGAPAGGTLGGGCRLFDHMPGILLDNPTDLWTIEVAAAGELEISMSSAAFSPMVMLLDDTREFVLASDAAGGAGDPDPLDAELVAHVSPGRYHVLASPAVSGSAGEYMLTAASSPVAGEVCAPAEIAVDVAHAGSLDATDCRLSLTAASMVDASNVDFLRVFVPQPGTVRFALDGEGFTPSVRLLDMAFQPLLAGRLLDDDVVRIPFAGSLLVAVQSLEGTGGAYEVELQHVIEGTTDCMYQAIGTTDSVAGALSPEDCTLEDFALLADTSRVDLYVVTLPSRGRLTVEQRSGEIDAYLWVIAGLFEYNLQNDDDEAGSTDARLSLILPAGQYIIAANSVLPEIGAYTLTTEFAPLAAAPCPLTDIGPNAAHDGELGPADCLASDLDPTRYSATPVKRYAVTLGERGRFAASVTSESFFPRLIMRDPASGRTVLEAGDEERFVMEADVELVVGPGVYWLEVEDLDGLPDFTGAYRLTTTFTPEAAPACEVVEITALPFTREDAIDPTDCLLRDRLGDYPQNGVDEYVVDLPRRGTLTIDLTSDDWDEFDPYLELHDYRYTPVAANNDTVEGFLPDAQIELEIGPGRYRILAMEARLLHGAYTLDVAFEPLDFTPPPISPTPPTSPTTPSPGGPTPIDPTPVEPTPTPPVGTPTVWTSTIYLPKTDR